MESDKTILLRAFNKQFFEFIDDIIFIYPDNAEMLVAKDAFLTFKKLNPTSIIKVWYSEVYCKYKQQIDAGDVAFFTEKDYSSDLSDSGNNLQNILNMIEKVRDPIKNMSESNKAQVAKYIKNLSKISTAYTAL